MTTQYILDSSAIVSNPEILSIEDASSLYVPYAVIQEIGRNSSRFSDLIRNAVAHGAVVEVERSRIGAKRLNTDAEIVAAALNSRYRKAFKNVVVVTRDSDIFNALHGTEVECISPAEFLIRHSDKRRDEISTRLATLYSKSLVWKIFTQIIIGVACIIISYILIKNSQAILKSTPIWGTIIATPLLGCTVFWIRQHYRLSYGITEFGVGMLSVYSVLFPRFDYSQLQAVQLLQVVAGIYILVRGLDNIGNGISKTRFASDWNRLFGERS